MMNRINEYTVIDEDFGDMTEEEFLQAKEDAEYEESVRRYEERHYVLPGWLADYLA